MNSLQSELDNINAQLELLTYRKTQLDSIIAEYSDVVNRVKSLVSSMEDAMVEPTNLLLEIEGLIHGETELTPIENLIKEQSELKPIEEQLTESEPETEPIPETNLNSLGLPVQTSPEPVRLMACVPVMKQSLPIKLNSNAYRRNDTLLIGFSNKRLMNQWTKWIKDNWGGRVNVSVDVDDEPSKGFPFPHCLSVLWYGNGALVNWERLTNLNYTLRPDEQIPPQGIPLPS